MIVGNGLPQDIRGLGGLIDGTQNFAFENTGDGFFRDVTATHLPPDTDVTRGLALADIDGDTDLDLFVANDFGEDRLLINDGAGRFVEPSNPVVPLHQNNTAHIEIGDIDGDGDVDALLSSNRQNRLWLNRGDGTFDDRTEQLLPRATAITFDAALGDVDNDGDLDLAIGNLDGQNVLHLNAGGGHFVPANRARLPMQNDRSASLALGDVNGDGFVDLFVGNGTASTDDNQLLLNDGTGQFRIAHAPALTQSFSETADVALEDLDGDGDVDIVTAETGAGGRQNRLYLNDGTGDFVAMTVTNLPLRQRQTQTVAAGDFDGDGDLDLVFGNSGSPDARNDLFLNDGRGSFSLPATPALPMVQAQTVDIALGDVDNDGDLDIVTANHFGELNRLYLNSGDARFADATSTGLPRTNGDTFSVELGDIDGDGDLDLICGEFAQQNRVLINDGNGRFTDDTEARLPLGSDTTRSVELFDADLDGDLDLLEVNFDQPSRFYVNNGLGVFADATSERMTVVNRTIFAVAIGDIDGDADVDAVLGDSAGQNRVLINMHRQIETPVHPRLGQRYTIAVYAEPGYGMAAHSATPLLSFGAAPRPILVPGLGNLTIDPSSLLNLGQLEIPIDTGVATTDLLLPLDPDFAGRTLYLQAAVTNAATAEIAFTSRTADVIVTN